MNTLLSHKMELDFELAVLSYERVNRGWSLGYVGSRLGVSGATVSRWERGLSYPSVDMFYRWCDLLGRYVEVMRDQG